MNGEFFLTGLYVLDNFSAHAVEFNSVLYPTVEHGYQAAKFFTTSAPIALSVQNCTSPVRAKAMAQQYSELKDPEWESKKVRFMESLLRSKLTQHDDVREALLGSGDSILVENNPEDAFWGVGSDGRGENMMGLLWMKLRRELQR